MREIELETQIDEMDEDDLRETFSQVMDAHTDNIEEFSEIRERADRVDEVEENLEIAVDYFSEKATDVTNLSEELLASRFSVEELAEMAEKADEAQEFVEDEDGDGDGDDGGDGGSADVNDSIFSEQEQKSGNFSGNVDDRKEQAKERLTNVNGLSL